MSATCCDHCGGPSEGPGAVTIQILDDQGLEPLGRVRLCPGCAREFGLWVHRAEPYADPPETEADDDLVADSDGGGP